MEFRLKNESVKTRENKISQNKPLNITHFNEDKLSKYVNILNKFILLAAKGKHINIKRIHASTGAHSDTVPFRLRKYDVIDIFTEAASLYTHTAKDTPDKVDTKILLDTCVLFKETIKMIDNNYKINSENQEF